MGCLWVALGLVLVFEGIPWFLSPTGVRRMLRRLAVLPDRWQRLLGFGLMSAGLMVVWLATAAR